MKSARRQLISTATVAVAAAAMAAPWGPAQADDRVEDYRVTLERTPPVEVDVSDLGRHNVALVRAKCPGAFRPGSPFPIVGQPFACRDVALRIVDAAATVRGIARNRKEGRAGNFSLSCDFAFPGTTDVFVTLGPDFIPTAVTLAAIRATGPVACAWNIVFTGETAGSLSGTATGRVTLSRVPDQQLIAAAVDLDVAIVTGTGEYRSAVGGGGTYVDTYDAPFEPEAATAATLAVGAPASLTATTAATPGRLHLSLGHRRSRARVVPVATPVRSTDPHRLRVVAPKGAVCRGVAESAGAEISLGKARVRRLGGQATMPGTIGAALTTPGTWQVSATCRAGERRLRAPAVPVQIG